MAGSVGLEEALIWDSATTFCLLHAAVTHSGSVLEGLAQ